MIEERRNTRRELLGKLLTLGPLAALAAAFGVNGAKKAEAATFNEDVIINSPYKLGVGTSSPGNRLHVVGPGDNVAVMIESPSYSTMLQLVDPSPVSKPVMHIGVVGSIPQYMYIFANYAGSRSPTIGFTLATRNAGIHTEAIKVTGDGNVGIGTPSPAARLDVVGLARATRVQGSGVIYDGWGESGILTQNIGANSWGNNGFNDAPLYVTANAIDFITNSRGGLVGGIFPLRMRISQDGKVGIGKDNPVFPLDVQGDIALTGVLEGAARKSYYDA